MILGQQQHWMFGRLDGSSKTFTRLAMVLAHMLAHIENWTICRFGARSDPSLVYFNALPLERDLGLANCVPRATTILR